MKTPSCLAGAVLLTLVARAIVAQELADEQVNLISSRLAASARRRYDAPVTFTRSSVTNHSLLSVGRLAHVHKPSSNTTRLATASLLTTTSPLHRTYRATSKVLSTLSGTSLARSYRVALEGMVGFHELRSSMTSADINPSVKIPHRCKETRP